MIQFEKEICRYLNIPSIPKKSWDGKSSFTQGIAVIELISGGQAFAVAVYNAEIWEAPHIVKVFSLEPYANFTIHSVVPDYMQTDGIEDWDIDDSSKKKAKAIINEVKDMETSLEEEVKAPLSEYCYDFIHNDDEAKAFLRSKLSSKKGRKTIPTDHDGLITKLTAMWLDEHK